MSTRTPHRQLDAISRWFVFQNFVPELDQDMGG